MAGTLVANTINTDTGLFSTNNAYNGIAKAWVSFDGLTGSTATIRGSFNVSSVTRNGTGDYTVSFTTSMPNINYSYNVSNAYYYSAGGLAAQLNVQTGGTESAPTTSSCRFVIVAFNSTPFDCKYVNVAVMSS